jgi:non-ribosomal peptide synthetase component F
VWGLEPALSERLAQVARTHGATYYVVRLAVFSALLAAHPGQPAVVLGTYVAQRSRIELQNMCGSFAHLVPLRLPWDPTQPFHRWLATVRMLVGDIQAHGALPYEQLCEAMRQRGVTPPAIHAIFSVAEHTAPIRFGGLELTWYDTGIGPRMVTMPWGFSMVLDEHQEDRRCSVTFDAHLYDPARVRAFIGRFVRLLEAVSRHPNLPLATLLAMSTPAAPPQSAARRWWSWATDMFHRRTRRARG